MWQQLTAFVATQLIQLDTHEFWIVFIILVIISLWLFMRMVRWWNHSRMIVNIPTSKIRSAPQGYVELVGNARMMDGPVIVSPLSQTICVWYRYKIEEKVSIGKSQRHWKVVKDGTSDELFILEDDTGRCIIDPDNADVIATNKKKWTKHTVSPVRRYTEELIIADEALYAIGLFKTVANVERQKQTEQLNYLLREWKSDPNKLLHDYDTNRDGELSPEEWEHARLAAKAQVKRELGHAEKLEQLNILKMSPHKNQGFILSAKPEDELISQYQFRSLVAMLGFFILGSFAVWALNIRLGL